jgi:hypothetical protein
MMMAIHSNLVWRLRIRGLYCNDPLRLTGEGWDYPFPFTNFNVYMHSVVGRDSSIGIANLYGLDCPGIESQCGCEVFRTSPDRPWGPPSLLYNGRNAAGAWR